MENHSLSALAVCAEADKDFEHQNNFTFLFMILPELIQDVSVGHNPMSYPYRIAFILPTPLPKVLSGKGELLLCVITAQGARQQCKSKYGEVS